jgi:hypothetical protein
MLGNNLLFLIFIMNKKNGAYNMFFKSPRDSLPKADDSKISNRSKIPSIIPSVQTKNPTSETRSVAGDVQCDGEALNKQEPVIEFKNINHKVLHIMDGTLEMLDEKLTPTIDEGERYELVESDLLKQQRTDNEEMKNKKIDLTDIYNELVVSFNDALKDLTKTKGDYNIHEEQKLKNSNELYNRAEELKEIYIQSHKIMEMSMKESTEKDNILRALIRLVDNTGIKLPKELRELYVKFNNDYYGFSSKPDKSKKFIETLNENIKKLEGDYDKKCKELNKVKSILNIQD